MPVLDLKDCTIYIRDRATNWVEVVVGEGNLTYNEKRNIETDKDRGHLARIREGEQEPTEVSFQFYWELLKSSGSELPSIEEALKGEYSGWISTASNPVTGDLDTKAPFSVHIQIVRIIPNCTQSEQYLFADFNFTELNGDMRNSTVDCKGICNHVQKKVQRQD